MFPRIPKSERTCLNCRWFDFNYGRVDAFGDPITPLNRECLYPGKIVTVAGRCQRWKDQRTLLQRLRGVQVQKGFC